MEPEVDNNMKKCITNALSPKRVSDPAYGKDWLIDCLKEVILVWVWCSMDISIACTWVTSFVQQAIDKFDQYLTVHILFTGECIPIDVNHYGNVFFFPHMKAYISTPGLRFCNTPIMNKFGTICSYVSVCINVPDCLLVLFTDQCGIAILQSLTINTVRLRQNGRHFADDIFNCIFLNKNV